MVVMTVADLANLSSKGLGNAVIPRSRRVNGESMALWETSNEWSGGPRADFSDTSANMAIAEFHGLSSDFKILGLYQPGLAESRMLGSWVHDSSDAICVAELESNRRMDTFLSTPSCPRFSRA